MTQPPAPANVIVTRPEPDASAFATDLRRAGFNAIVSPVLRIAFQGPAPDLAGVAALAFTSANGVRAYLKAGGPNAIPAFAVGPTTANAAKEAGFPDVVAAQGDVGSLAATIASARIPSGAILHIAGRHQADDLAAALKGRGVNARWATLYTAEAESDLAPAAHQAIVDPDTECWAALFSQRSAKTFLALVDNAGLSGKLPAIACACLSDAVATAAGVGWRRRLVASEPSGRSLINAIRAETGRP